MISRRRFLASAVAVVAAPLPGEAQPPKKVSRIGWLTQDTSVTTTRLNEAFRQSLRELGYVEGETLVIEYRSGRTVDRLPSAAAELVRLKVDLIFAPEGTPSALAAKNATSTIPIVIALVADPVAFGLVHNLARPGGNITGPSVGSGLELFGKRLELLKEALPKVSRVAVLWDPNNPGSVVSKRTMEAPAHSFRFALQSMTARTPAELEPAFSAMRRAQAEALVVLSSPLMIAQLKQIVDLTAKSRLPAIYMENRWVEGGGLMSYGPSYLDVIRRAAIYVDKVLKGAKPGDLPIEQPTKFELVVNLKTAKVLGLTIPPSLLLRADQVIE